MTSSFGAVGSEVDRVRVLVADWDLEAELIEIDAGRELPSRIFLVALDDEQQMDLLERATTTGDAVFVALDADGNELGRVAVPLLPAAQR